MITSSSISYVSQMLEEPQNISGSDADSIIELTETYPYFVPARYMQAAQQHKLEPFSPALMTRMQLFSGNWLLYSEYLQSALGEEEVEFTATTDKVTEAKQETPATIVDDATDEDVTDKQDEIEAALNDIVPEQEPEIETYSRRETTIHDTPKEKSSEGFTPANTGFVRGKKNNTKAPIPAVEIEQEEEVVPDQPTAETEVEEQAKEEQTIQEQTNQTLETSQFNRPLDKSGWDEKSENLIPPIYTEDYFLHQGMNISNDIPEELGNQDYPLNTVEQDKSLMVVMSFSEWLMFYKKKKQQAQEEEQDQKDLKTMWQKEKLAAALEEENEEIPENVFEMAVNSITKEENLASESLAGVMVKQGRYDRAIEMYKKLSLQKPQKKAYFARKIEEILKEK